MTNVIRSKNFVMKIAMIIMKIFVVVVAIIFITKTMKQKILHFHALTEIANAASATIMLEKKITYYLFAQLQQIAFILISILKIYPKFIFHLNF